MSIYELRDVLAKDFNTDDYAFREGLLLKIHSARSTIISQTFNKTRMYDKNFETTIFCNPVKYTKYAECNDCSNHVIKTEFEIPKFINFRDSGYSIRISSSSAIGKTISIINQSELEFMSTKRFSKNKPYAVIVNNHIVIYNVPKNMESVNITACWENIQKVEEYSKKIKEFNSECGEVDLDIPEILVQGIMSLILKNLQVRTEDEI
jgi:hypothetical protein